MGGLMQTAIFQKQTKGLSSIEAAGGAIFREKEKKGKEDGKFSTSIKNFGINRWSSVDHATNGPGEETEERCTQTKSKR